MRGTEEPGEFVLPGVINIAGLDKFNFTIVNAFRDHGEFRVGNLKVECLNSFASRRYIDEVELPHILDEENNARANYKARLKGQDTFSSWAEVP